MVLIETEGRGGAAEVEIDGERLAVVDALSEAGAPARPGPVVDPRLEVVTIPHLCGRAGEEAREKRLVREWGWRYRGRGEVVGTAPLRVDLGAFSFELDLVALADLEPGDLVDVAIDRIVLSRRRA